MCITEFFQQKRTRQEIAEYFNCSDRDARAKIAELQENYNIVNMQDGKGYFLADDETVKKYAQQEMSRALKSFDKARKMLKRVESAKGIKIPVKAHFRRINASEEKDTSQIEFF